VSVRKIESRLPANYHASDFGEAVESQDGRCALISFLTSPLPAGHENTYVLFVTDPSMAGSIKSYEWHIAEDGAFPVMQRTDVGEINYQPINAGNTTVTARILDAGAVELGKITIIQEIGPLNPALETQIADAVNKPGPGVSNPEVIREVVNDYYSYYQNVTLKVPEPGDAFKRFICSFLFDGTLKNTHENRKTLLNQLAAAVENNGEEFSTIIAAGVGVCDIRLGLLAMNFPLSAPLLEWTELPEAPDKSAFADEQLRQNLVSLSEADKIDLVNISRFPKTNITLCAHIVETLRDKYFAGASFNDVMTGMSGTRQHWIAKHYSQGPIAR
jgi:hypothetical protein